MNEPPDLAQALQSLETEQRALRSSLRRDRLLFLGLTLLIGGLFAVAVFVRDAGDRARAGAAPTYDEALGPGDERAAPAASSPADEITAASDLPALAATVEAVESPPPSPVSESTPQVAESPPPVAESPPQGAEPPPARVVASVLEQEVAELTAQVAGLTAQLDEARRANLAQTQQIDRLRADLRHKDGALSDALGRLEQTDKAEREAREAIKTEVSPLPRDPLVEAVNSLLLEHAVLEYRLLEYRELSEHELRDTRWALCNGRGTAIGVLFAARCQLAVDAANQSVVIRLVDGWSTRGADKETLTEQRWVIASANLKAWNAPPLDQLFPAGSAVISAARTPSPLALDKLHEQLATLLEKHGFTLRKLDGVDGTELKRIIVDEGVPGVTPKRTISAEVCRVHLVEPGGYVELVFENGSISRRGREMKFYGNRYRLALPHSVPSEWQEALPGILTKRDNSRA